MRLFDAVVTIVTTEYLGLIFLSPPVTNRRLFYAPTNFYGLAWHTDYRQLASRVPRR